MTSEQDRTARCRITGQLKLKTPLHIGDGNDRPARISENSKDDPVICTICSDAAGKPYIPGSALRGCLRAWTEGTGADDGMIRQVWGIEGKSGDREEDQGRSGRVYVRDAFFNPTDSVAPNWPSQPENAPFERHYWEKNRWTWIENGVAINRFTGTASHQKLFYYEVVPPNTVFDVVIDGVGLTDHEVGWLLTALRAFNMPRIPIQLGAGRQAGYGQFEWRNERLFVLTKDARRAWLANPENGMTFENFPETCNLDDTLIIGNPASSSMLALEIELRFDGPMLVNDTSRCHKNADGDTGGVASPDHAFFTDHQDRLLIPGRSVRGALRSRAEKILRTMAEFLIPRLPPEQMKSVACYPHDLEFSCKTVQDAEQIKDICTACRLFGIGGLQSPMWVGPFEVVNDPETLTQEFVAIDRFTGGAAPQKKYNALAAYRPVFQGIVAIDLIEIDKCHLGLLCLLFRDLVEGDIAFGFGKTKGYAACTATLKKIHKPDAVPEAFKEIDAALPGVDPLPAWTPDIREQLGKLVRELETHVRQKTDEVLS